MYNRQPTPGQEGRMRIIPENGDPAFFAKVEMADNPLNKGTPLTVETLLKHTTRALYGLPESAVPDDVLAFLGKYNLHWWKRRGVSGRYEKVETAVTNSTHRWLFNENYGIVYSYSDSVSVSSTGVVSLGGTVKTFTAANVAEFNANSAALVGRYFTVNKEVRSVNNSEVCLAVGTMYYIPTGATFNTYSDGQYTSVSALSNITSKYTEEIGEWEYLYSSDRNAYPDSGVTDGVEYRYLGVPFENSVTAPKIEMGTYKGTNTVGSNNKNSISFSSLPYLVIITGSAYGMFVTRGETYAPVLRNAGGGLGCHVSWIGNTMYWYSQQNNDYYAQMNSSSVTYTYIAVLDGGMTK